MQECFVVQSIRRGQFLKMARDGGDPDTTDLIAQAGFFLDREVANNSGIEWFGQGEYTVFGFYLPFDDRRLQGYL